MAMTDKTRKVFDFLKENNDKNMTAEDIAEALDLGTRQVNGIFTSAFQRKGLGVRKEAEIELPDGSHKPVKYLHLTEQGLTLDPDNQE